MNTDEIHSVFRVFLQIDNVYSIYTLPPHPNRLLVCNLNQSHHPGSHWLAIYVGGGGVGEYFDSMGRAPPDVIQAI